MLLESKGEGVWKAVRVMSPKFQGSVLATRDLAVWLEEIILPGTVGPGRISITAVSMKEREEEEALIRMTPSHNSPAVDLP